MAMNMTSEPQLALGMWVAMMAAMMLPGAAPAVVRVSGLRTKALFIAAYLALWSAFGAAAALLQYALESHHLLTNDMAVRSRAAAALSLVAIGVYQLTPLKRACLRLCRSPEVRPLRYGLACLGASWPLMAILFVVGVMSYFWIVVVALWIAAEKAFRWGGALAAAAGVALIGWGGAGLLL
jgi:predicted metal-binding membrane protein